MKRLNDGSAKSCWRVAFLVGGVLGLAACVGDRRWENTVAPPSSNATRAMGVVDDRLPRNIRPEEEGFAVLSEHVPSSAGYYIDREGSTVVLVRDSAEFGAARTALLRLRPQMPYAPTRGTIRVEKAKYSFAQLARWRDLIFDKAFSSTPGVTSLDLDEARNRVVIGVDQAQLGNATEGVQRTLAQLDIDTAAIIIQAETPLQWSGGVLNSFRGSVISPDLASGPWSSVVGGIMMIVSATDPDSPMGGASGGCTVGFTTLYTPPSASPYRAVVSASHCTAQWGFLGSTTFTVNGISGNAGTEAVDATAYSCGITGSCRASDAALFQLAPTAPYELGLIARPHAPPALNQDVLNPWFMVRGTTPRPTGAPYSKIGRTSGWTTGTVHSTCVDHSFGGSLGVFSLKTHRCQDVGTAYNTGGDSGGSVFFRVDTLSVDLLGTTVGHKKIGSTTYHVWSPYSRIASDMPGTMVVHRPATLSAPAAAGSTTGMGSSQAYFTWTAVPGATEYFVQVQDYINNCDPYWGCSLVPMSGYEVTTSTTMHLDTRLIFSVVIPLGSPSPSFTSFVVSGRNRLTGERSWPSNEVWISH